MPSVDELPFPGVAVPAHPLWNARFTQALRASAIAHGGDYRKGTRIPYIAHPLGVCSIAMGYGADEDEAIAALLHDVLEDVRPTNAAEQTVSWFGDRVFAIVRHCTDGMPGPDGRKAPSLDRKAAYIERIGTGDRSELLVSASDKLHNARSIVADLRTDGERVWERFNVTKSQQLDYYSALVAAFRANRASEPALVEELARTVADMWHLAGRDGLS